jgi:hypothetical protein
MGLKGDRFSVRFRAIGFVGGVEGRSFVGGVELTGVGFLQEILVRVRQGGQGRKVDKEERKSIQEVFRT